MKVKKKLLEKISQTKIEIKKIQLKQARFIKKKARNYKKETTTATESPYHSWPRHHTRVVSHFSPLRLCSVRGVKYRALDAAGDREPLL